MKEQVLNKINLESTKKWCKTFSFTLLTLLSHQSFSQCNNLVWSDEFDGSVLNTNNWSYVIGNGCNGSSGCGFGNGERQYYTNSTNNVNVTGGNLVLTARRQVNYNNSGSDFTSGKIETVGKQSWKYGRYEARIKVPSTSAIWPAFWMLPTSGTWPYGGEIDVMETQNKTPKNATQTVHYYCTPCGNHQYNYNSYNTGTDWSLDYHVYAVDWSPAKIIFSVDGVVTATHTPTTIGSTGAKSSDWPFDAKDFFLILNLAVGGSYTGNAVPVNADYPVSMYVDYVRVYSNGSPLSVTGPKISFVGETQSYSASDAGPSATYSWSVPIGASILSGQGSKTISVAYNAPLSANVSVIIDADGNANACSPVNVSFPVKAITNTCSLIISDFENNSNLGSNNSDGSYSNNSNNPGAGGSNSSATCASYSRNAGVQYDVLSFTSFKVGNPDDFKTGVRKFTMDVRSSAPSGTSITIEFLNSAKSPQGYPNGIHSQYTAKTGASNTWTTLTFSWLATPDPTLNGSDVDKMQMLFNPNSYTNHQYYFDNLKAQGSTPATSAISGPASTCLNLKGAAYSVTGSTGSTFTWTVPAGATIVSGQGSKAITVDFVINSGDITVTEINGALCSGSTKTLAISLSGNCPLTVDFSANKINTCLNSSITFTDLTAGKLGGETYLWNFGAGANPASSTSAGPVQVQYSASGSKTISLTIGGSSPNSSKTKINYVTVGPQPTSCLFSDEFSDNSVKWMSPTPSAFTHTESNHSWKVSANGHQEWDSFSYSLNDGSTAMPIDFSCSSYAAIAKITAKASSNVLLRMTMQDGANMAADNYTALDLELTTSYQTFTIDFSKHFKNTNGNPSGSVDSSNVSKLLFNLNPGYHTYPITGKNAVYNSSFAGSVTIDWIGIGNNCSALYHDRIIEVNSNTPASAFPNPFYNETILRFEHAQNEKVAIKIYDYKGALVFEGNDFNSNENIVFGKNLAQGMYFVEAQYLDQKSNIRIVKIE